MKKFIDLGLGLPPDKGEVVSRLRMFFLNSDGRGRANYHRIFGPRVLESFGLEYEDVLKHRLELSDEDFESYLGNLADEAVVPLDDFVTELDEAGIEWGLIFPHLDDNEGCAASIAKAPTRLKGIAAIDPSTGTDAVENLRQAINEFGFRAYYASPFDWGIRADDPLFYPLYEEACALEVPVFIYTSMNYRTDRSMDIGRPLYLDKVAMDFPSMKIVAECGGWPWVPEMIGLARRHSNVFINTCSHRPKYLAVPGSGWEMLMRFGNSLLQDQVLFASGATDMGLSIGQVVREMLELPLKDSVKEKWMYTNALRLFEIYR
jgi:hypothetical protein